MVIRFENLNSKNVTTKLGVSNYKYNEATGEKLTPHVLQRKALDIFERRPFIHAGINQMISFISGQGLIPESVDEQENEKGIKWMTEWIRQRKKNLELSKYQAILTFLVQGNAYVETVYRPHSDELDNIFTIYDSSRIYYNTADEKDSEGDVHLSGSKAHYWLFRVADDIASIKWRGTPVSVASYMPYKYSPSSVYFEENIKAFSMPKHKLKHLRAPYTMDGFYGYSFIMSTVDDEEAITKIIRNMILISSNKAIGKKIIGFWNENGKTIPEQDIADIQDQLDFEVGSNLVVNKKFEVADLAHTGTYDTLMNEVEYLTKDVGAGLTPSFMTPWNSDVNRATAEQARLPFMVHIEKIKEQIEDFFNEVIMEPLREKHEFLKGVKLTFGETQYFSLEERKEFYGSLYDSNVITLNQYLKAIDMKPLENGDIFARNREAMFDMEYEEMGNDKFKPVGAGTTNTEGVKGLQTDLYKFEHDEEIDDTNAQAKRQIKDAADEIGSILNRHLK